MRLRKEINIRVSGLDSEEDWKGFIDCTADFWAGLIEKNVNELPISYREKLEFVERVLQIISFGKNGEENNKAVL